MTFQSALRVGQRCLDTLLGALLLAIVIVTIAATTNRYLLGGSMPWSFELTLLIWVWLIQFAALRTDHIRMDFVLRILPRSIQIAAQLLIAAVCVLSLLVLTWSAFGQMLFYSTTRYASMPWLAESWEFVPMIIVGPIWLVLLIVQALRPPSDETET